MSSNDPGQGGVSRQSIESDSVVAPPKALLIQTPLAVPRAIKPKIQVARKEALASIATILCGASVVPENLRRGVTEMYDAIAHVVGRGVKRCHIQQLVGLARHVNKGSPLLERAFREAIQERIDAETEGAVRDSLNVISDGIDWQILRSPTKEQLVEWYVQLGMPIPGARIEEGVPAPLEVFPATNSLPDNPLDDVTLSPPAPSRGAQILISDVDGGKIGLELPSGSEISITESDGTLVIRKVRGPSVTEK